jgi:PTH1 family peptidyl-tRNA hydrolase
MTSSIHEPPMSARLIVGLGNPGSDYLRHRHNVGFRIVGRLAGRHGLAFDRLQHKARVATGRVAGERVILAKPLTYMNKSGESVGPLLHWYKLSLDHLLVIYDDLDIPLGDLRLRPQGGSGGHRGMRSIIQQLGSGEFARLRVGIGRPPPRWDPADYVLSPFTEDELPMVEDVCERAVAAAERWLAEGVEVAMNEFNT